VGYRVIPLPKKKKTPHWKVQFEDRTNGTRKAKDIPREQWLELGFLPSMTVDEARARRDQLNAQEEMRRRAVKRRAIDERLAEEELTQTAFLSPIDTAEFEEKYVFSRIPVEQRGRHKVNSYWRAAKRVICAVKLPPNEWFALKHIFYDHFSAQKMSPSYVRKLLQLINLYGFFLATKRGLPFLQIPAPRGREAQRIADAYFDKNEDGLVSAPLDPKKLEAAKSNFKPAQYNWLYLTVWFGLRPLEADNVKNPKHTKIVRTGKRVELHVYQSKLRSVPRPKRWKVIPCLHPAQLKGIEIIATQNVERPLNKTIRAHIDDAITGYGGRKNFVDMMLDLGHKLETIAQWMGHSSIERTWRSYKDRQRPEAA